MKTGYRTKKRLPAKMETLHGRLDQLEGAENGLQQAEEALRESEERYRTLVDLSPDAILVLSEGRVVYVNAAGLSLYGAAVPEELIGRTTIDFIHPDYRAKIAERMRLILQQGQRVPSMEAKLVRLDGQVIQIEGRGALIVYQGKQAVQVVLRDITQRKRAEEEIRHLALAVATANDGIVIADLDGMISFTNEAEERILGYGPGEMIGMEVWSLHPESTRDIEARGISDATLSDGHWAGEVVLQRKGGEEVPVRLSTSLMQNEDGQPVGMVGIITDITERKQAEEALRESEERYRTLVDLSPDAINVVQEGKYVYVNSAGAKLFGAATGEELVGRPVMDFVHPDARAKIGERMRQIKEQGQRVDPMVAKHLRLDGQVVDIEGMGAPIVYQGKPAVQVVLRDITQRKRAEEALRQSEESFRTIFERSNDAIFVTDPELDEILDVNPMACGMLGYSRQELTSIPISAVHPNEVPKLRAFVQSVMEEGRGWTDELTCTTKNGRVVLTEISASTADIQGKRRIICMVRDITERKQAEERMREESRLLSMGGLVAEVAHELNNPLTAVLGYAQLLEARELEASVKEDVKYILTESQRAVEIVRNMLSLARKREPEKSCLDVAAAVERVLTIKGYDLKVNGIEVVTQFDSSPLYVMADQHRLEEVFLNLVTNAEQAMAEANRGGRLLIRGIKRDDFTIISFTDNGPGITPEHLEDIFNPFFTSKEEGKGTGLGLSICKNLIREQGGTIRVESEFGKGATFHVELPAGEHPQ